MTRKAWELHVFEAFCKWFWMGIGFKNFGGAVLVETWPTLKNIQFSRRTEVLLHGQGCVLGRTEGPLHGQVCFLGRTEGFLHGQLCQEPK